jgi:hypothetical protein
MSQRWLKMDESTKSMVAVAFVILVALGSIPVVWWYRGLEHKGPVVEDPEDPLLAGYGVLSLTVAGGEPYDLTTDPSRLTMEGVEYLRNALCDPTAPFAQFDEIWIGNSSEDLPMTNITHTAVVDEPEKVGRHKYNLEYLFDVGTFEDNENLTEVAVCNMYGVPLLYFSVTQITFITADSLLIEVFVTFGEWYNE